MEQLLKDQGMGRGFPSCSMVDNPSTRIGSYAAPMPANYYKEYPTGTTAFAVGAYAIMSPIWTPADSTPAWVSQQTLYTGVGDGSALSPSTGLPVASMPPEVCVSGLPIGQVALGIGLMGGSLTVPIFSSVTILKQQTARNVGVWTDGALNNQVHW
jgi:hypothetical protein